MNDWVECALSGVSESFAGGTPSRSISAFYGGDIPWVKSTEVNQAAVWNTDEFLTELGLKMSNCKLAPKNSVLIAMYGATAGQVSKLKIEAATNQAVLAIVCLSDLYSDFLFYTLINAKEKILYLAQGSGQPNLSKQLIDKTKIKLPPLPQQKKIAKILTTVDNLIEQTQALIDKYTAIKQGMMADLFARGIDLSGTPETNPNHGQLRPSFEEAPELYKETELGWVPREWKVKALNEIVDPYRPIVYGILMPGHGVDKGVPVIKVKDIKNGEVKEKDLLLTTFEIDQQYQRSKVKCGDILYTIRGTVGRIAMVPMKLNGANITQDTARISIQKGDSIFYKFFLNSTTCKHYSELNTLGVAVQGINLGELRKMPILFPSIIEQEQIRSGLQNIEKLISSEQEYIAVLQKQKKGLMQDLLTGKVQVTA